MVILNRSNAVLEEVMKDDILDQLEIKDGPSNRYFVLKESFFYAKQMVKPAVKKMALPIFLAGMGIAVAIYAYNKSNDNAEQKTEKPTIKIQPK
jgi:hypothetical protein